MPILKQIPLNDPLYNTRQVKASSKQKLQKELKGPSVTKQELCVKFLKLSIPQGKKCFSKEGMKKPGED